MKAIIAILAIFFFTDIFQVFEVGGYGVTLIDISFLAFFTVFIKRLVWDGDKLQFAFHPALIFLAALPIAAILSGLTPFFKGDTPQMIQFIKTFAHFIFLILFTLICAFYKIESKTWSNYVKVFLIASILINVFGIYQIFARAYDLPLAWIQFTNVSITGRSATESVEDVQQLSLKYGNFFRATSIFPEPSALASFNVLIQIFILVPFVQKTKAFFKSGILNGIIFSFSLISLFLCFSMTGFVGMAMVIGSIFIFHRSKRLYPFIGGFFASIILLFLTDSVIERFSGVSVVELFSKRIAGILFSSQGTAGESFNVRLNSGKVGIEIWEDHPVNGAGLGLTSYNNNKGVDFGDFSTIAALAEMGIIGFVAFIGMFIALFYTSIKLMFRLKNKDDLDGDDKRWAGLLYYLLLHQFLINFVSGNNLVKFILWMFIAMVFATINNILSRNNKVFSIAIAKIGLKFKLNTRVRNFLNLKKQSHEKS